MFKYEITGDRVSTVVEMQITTVNGVLLSERKVFLNPAEAQHYVQSHLHQYLVMKLRKYIMHAFNIGVHSTAENYNHTERVSAMSLCLDYLRRINHQNLHAIVLWVKQNKDSLTKILPLVQNTSYNTAQKNLAEIINLVCQLKLN